MPLRAYTCFVNILPKSFLRNGSFCSDGRTTKALDQMLIYLTERTGKVGMYVVAVFGMK